MNYTLFCKIFSTTLPIKFDRPFSISALLNVTFKHAKFIITNSPKLKSYKEKLKGNDAKTGSEQGYSMEPQKLHKDLFTFIRFM